MKLIKNVSVLNPSGQEIKVDVEAWGRPNNYECVTHIIRYKGRRIAPYEQGLRGWKFTLNGLFKLTYSEPLFELVFQPNPYLSKILENIQKSSLYPIPVILGLEHGVTFGTKDE